MSNVLSFKRGAPVGYSDSLTAIEERVKAILQSEETSVAFMAEHFRVSEQTIRNIKMLKTKRSKKVHAHLVYYEQPSFTWEPAARFTAEQVAAIRASDKPSTVLAKEWECASSTIRMIRTHQTYNI